ncbi:biotin/lipoyl-containing protein [Candidatus Phytoplasma citri]|uniref:Lipoyl-binding domain-containing protein n=1 Tax=Candidatus Phytoplasma citri TaxID=180978 RepID=A0A1S9LYL5_9MOLU|nr:biotin/lipoyl-containing protein [Candidatus Phytoplasma aurantifolia]MDO8060179.1 hypothetical protein [Candidatus Phytoplasma aurantifolia]MDO8078808.1 hypothetical protein [Candidatus Phytoplasma aurantifolia]OOP58121.1 hypothetical protein B2G44_02015 [Candidatus Phytoplasma aurantifolia]
MRKIKKEVGLIVMKHKEKYEFKFYDLGEGLHEGTITKCLCKVGDKVKEGQGLFEIENDKLSDTLLSPVNGVILEIKCSPSDQVESDQVLAVIEIDNE